MMIDCPSAYVVDGDTLRFGPYRLGSSELMLQRMGIRPRWRVALLATARASRQASLQP